MDIEALIQWLNQDSDFMTEPYRVYLHPASAVVLGIYDDDDAAEGHGISSGENRENRRRVRLDGWIEIPIPGHAQHHQWFKSWLAKRGDEQSYFGSMGGWLEQCADEDDRRDWDNFRYDRVSEYARVAIAHAGGERP